MSSIRVSFYLPPLPSLIKPLFRCIRSGAFSHKKDSTIKREAFFIEFADRIRSFASLCRSCFSLSRSVSLTFVFFVFFQDLLSRLLSSPSLVASGPWAQWRRLWLRRAATVCSCTLLHLSILFRSSILTDLWPFSQSSVLLDLSPPIPSFARISSPELSSTRPRTRS